MDDSPFNPFNSELVIRYDCTCPISKISFEVLSHIFELAEESYRADFAPHVSVPAACALSFTRVCKFWYAVALKTPILWTSMVIATESSVHCAHKWLERSLKSKLLLDVRVTPDGVGLADYMAYSFLQHNLRRLGRLCLEIEYPYSPRYAWPSDGNTLVSLELVNVWMSLPSLYLLLWSSPRLEHLSVTRSPDRPDPSSFFEQPVEEIIPTSVGLTSLRLDTAALASTELCRLLHLFSMLQYLSLSFPSLLEATGTLPNVELPFLLAAALPVSELTERLFSHWKAPLLRATVFGHSVSCNDLRNSVIEGTVPWDTTCRLDFPHPDEFSMARQLFYLKHCPQVVHLEINGCKEGLNDIFDCICPASQEENGLPNLRSLSILRNKSKGDLDLFCQRYIARYGPLRTVTVHSDVALLGVDQAELLLKKHGTFYYEPCWECRNR